MTKAGYNGNDHPRKKVIINDIEKEIAKLNTTIKEGKELSTSNLRDVFVKLRNINFMLEMYIKFKE